ncbi:MAG: leucine-rich repeat domain-containing protein [Blautia sp.]|nr:leucine-rich repeat domain-containing protein [Blautia sp.]
MKSRIIAAAVAAFMLVSQPGAIVLAEDLFTSGDTGQSLEKVSEAVEDVFSAAASDAASVNEDIFVSGESVSVMETQTEAVPDDYALFAVGDTGDSVDVFQAGTESFDASTPAAVELPDLFSAGDPVLDSGEIAPQVGAAGQADDLFLAGESSAGPETEAADPALEVAKAMTPGNEVVITTSSEGVYPFRLSDLGTGLSDGYYVIKVRSDANTLTNLYETVGGERNHLIGAISPCKTDGETLINPIYFFSFYLYADKEYVITISNRSKQKEEVQASFEILPYQTNLLLDEGSCGQNVRFEVRALDPEGVTIQLESGEYVHEGTLHLVIKGSGPMEDYFHDYEGNAPWESPVNHHAFWTDVFPYRVRIAKVTVEQGVTHIGNFAFMQLDYLKELSIASSVASIGDSAFSHCPLLKNVVIPEGVQTIDKSAFRDCYAENYRSDQGNIVAKTGLESVRLPSSLTSIGQFAFYGNRCLQTVEYAGGDLGGLARICYGMVEYPNARIREVFAPMSPWFLNNVEDFPLTPGKESVIYRNYRGVPRAGKYEFTLGDLGKGAGHYRIFATVGDDAPTVFRLSKILRNDRGEWMGEEEVKGSWNRGTSSSSFIFTYDVDLEEGVLYNLRIEADRDETRDQFPVKFEIVKTIDINSCEAQLSFTNASYTGKALRPTVKVYSGSKLVPSSQYSVAYKNNIKAGTASVAVRSTTYGRLHGSRYLTFRIQKASGNLIIPKTAFTRAESASVQSFRLGISVREKGNIAFSSDNAGMRVSSTGLVSIKKNFVGQAKITVKAGQTTNYKAETKSITITVLPAAVRFTYCNSTTARQLLLRWTKNANAGGYQLQYSTNKSFTSGATKSAGITGAANLTRKVTGLPSGRTFYVRIRSWKLVSGKRYFSAWSAVQTVKVK